MNTHYIHLHTNAFMPICDEYDINMCVHPDDPPYPVFGGNG